MKRTILTMIMFLAAGLMAVAAGGIDINTASRSELQRIRGVGPATADRILEAREGGGPFADLDDVARRVKGIGAGTVARWREEGGVTVGPAAAAPAPAEITPDAPEPAVLDRRETIEAVAAILREHGYGNYQANNAAAARIADYLSGKAGFTLD